MFESGEMPPRDAHPGYIINPWIKSMDQKVYPEGVLSQMKRFIPRGYSSTPIG